MLGNDKKRINLAHDLISITEADGTLLKKMSVPPHVTLTRFLR